MSMTNEEAIEILKNGGWWESLIPVTTMKGRDEEDKLHEAIDLAISALRPITREHVEKTKAVFCQPCVGDFEQDTWRCSKCFVQEFGDVRGINFCPNCGAPMTDKAVNMVMERLEALKDD